MNRWRTLSCLAFAIAAWHTLISQSMLQLLFKTPLNFVPHCAGILEYTIWFHSSAVIHSFGQHLIIQKTTSNVKLIDILSNAFFFTHQKVHQGDGQQKQTDKEEEIAHSRKWIQRVLVFFVFLVYSFYEEISKVQFTNHHHQHSK